MSSEASAGPATFVLIHGMSGGGWWWRGVAHYLRARGHTVWAPTLPQRVTRDGLSCCDVTQHDYIDCVTDLFDREALNDVVLVGHSLGGIAISGVADRMPHRLKRLVYLDALITCNGQSATDLGHWLPVLFVKIVAYLSSGGRTVPAPPAWFLGAEGKNARDVMRRNAVRQPLSTLTVPIKLSNDLANGVPAVYITCTQPHYRATASSRELARECGWQVLELSASHAAPLNEPARVAEMLMSWS